MSIDFSTPFGQKVQQQLEQEQVIWLTTTSASGTPQPNLVWFLYQDGDVVVYTKPDALRLKNITNSPHVSLNFNSDAGGHEMTVLTGTAMVEPSVPNVAANDAYVQKYAEGIAAIGHTPQSMSDEYSVPIRITLRKARGW